PSYTKSVSWQHHPFLRQSKDEVCGPELLIEKLHQILTE
ncbi:hypothetical protein, partial [Salmonella sp. AM049]